MLETQAVTICNQEFYIIWSAIMISNRIPASIGNMLSKSLNTTFQIDTPESMVIYEFVFLSFLLLSVSCFLFFCLFLLSCPFSFYSWSVHNNSLRVCLSGMTFTFFSLPSLLSVVLSSLSKFCSIQMSSQYTMMQMSFPFNK